MARPSTGGGYAIADLQRMLDQRKNEVTRLNKRRSELERDLAQVDRQIAKLEGRGGGRGRGRGGRGSRAQNEQNLADTIEAVMREKGGRMGVGDVMEGVLSSGYRSNSANFRSIVNQALIKDKRFQKAERGLYQLKNTEGKGRKAKVENAA